MTINPAYLSADQQLLLDTIGEDAFIKLCEAYGGFNLYIPKLDKHGRDMRNKEICEKFNGYNAHHLAAEYGLTERQIRDIIKFGEDIGEQMEFE